VKRKLTVCIPDLHVPQYDPAALDWALAYAVKRRPDRVVLLGDVVDFLALSRFPKSPQQAAALHEEIESGRDVIWLIERRLAKVRNIVWLAGNHEQRVQKYLFKLAPELCVLPELSVPAMLRMPKRWQYVEPGGHVFDQGVLVMHGTRYAQNTCGKYLDEYACNVVAGHSHRANQMTRRLPSGQCITAIEAGCLCSFVQSYTQLNNWSHALVTIEGGRPELVRR